MDAYNDKELNRLEKELSEIDGIRNVQIESKKGEIGQVLKVTYFDKQLGTTLDFEVEAEAFDTFAELLDYCESMIVHQSDE